MVFLDAVAASVPSDNPVALFNALLEAFKGGHWSIFASVLIMGIVYAVEKVPFVSGMLKGRRKVWVAAIAGVLMAVATTAFTTGDWVRAAFDGLAAGLTATGLFELVRRKASGEPIDANNDGVLDTLPPGK